MVPVMAIVRGWRKGVSRLDAMAVDKEDEEAVAAYEKRKSTKHGIVKVPFVIGNLFKKLTGKKNKQGRGQQKPQVVDPVEAPQAYQVI